MTKQQFTALEGRAPETDDLERANCPKAGTMGHTACGICEHGHPVFLCYECFGRASGHGAPVKYQKKEVA